MKRLFSLALVLITVGCATLPHATREINVSERNAIDSAKAAFIASGRQLTECTVLDRAIVAPLPDAELQNNCLATWVTAVTGQPYQVSACFYQVNTWVFDPPRILIYYLDSLDDDGVASAVIHESLHVLNACSTHITADTHHTDAQLWGPIFDDAMQRWRAQN